MNKLTNIYWTQTGKITSCQSFYHDKCILKKRIAKSMLIYTLVNTASSIRQNEANWDDFLFQTCAVNTNNIFKGTVTDFASCTRVTLYTAGHLHTAVPHCSHSRAPIVHTAVPRENNEHGCVYLRCRAVCKLPGCVEGHPWCNANENLLVKQNIR